MLIKFKFNLKTSPLFNSLKILDPADLKKLILATILQSLLAFLDLAGVAAVAGPVLKALDPSSPEFGVGSK